MGESAKRVWGFIRDSPANLWQVGILLVLLGTLLWFMLGGSESQAGNEHRPRIIESPKADPSPPKSYPPIISSADPSLVTGGSAFGKPWVRLLVTSPRPGDDWTPSTHVKAEDDLFVYWEIHNHSEGQLRNPVIKLRLQEKSDADLTITVNVESEGAAAASSSALVVLDELVLSHLGYYRDSLKMSLNANGRQIATLSTPVPNNYDIFSKGVPVDPSIWPCAGFDKCFMTGSVKLKVERE